jgi:signal transduction histidine kinase
MHTLRVLVADDEDGMRHSISRALRHWQFNLPDFDKQVCFEIEGVDSGEKALERIAQQAPDILLLDHKMGGMSGVDVLEQIKKEGHAVLTVMITAFATIETAVRATKSGAFDFLAKPFTPDELKESIRKVATHLLVHRQAQQLAEEKRRIRFELIRVLGHELKAPLGAIESYLHVMADRTIGDDISAYGHVVERCLVRCEGMRKLIGDLLDMTRIEAGETVRAMARIDVRKVAMIAIENLRPSADQRHIAIQLDAPERLDMTGDEAELEIVLNNLVSNAVKYNRDGGRVDVCLDADEQHVVIAVHDTGIGMAAEDAGKLFNDFVRIKNDKTRDILGSGLGLSIVKKIAQLYEGQATVESEPDVGSTFTVTLKRHLVPAESKDGTCEDTGVASRN